MNNIMVIGAGGSLGSNLCKKLCDMGHCVTAIDVSENKLCYLYRLYDVDIHILDIQNTSEIINVINDKKITHIINCAAMKHVYSCEYNIKRAININIIANIDLIEYSYKNKLKYIYISSDKAINPTNVYALTKHFTDYLIKKFKFKLIRGVNFLYSNGSVLDIWEKERLSKQPYTVVQNECNRYFITLDQMTDIVIKALNDDNDQIEYCPSHVMQISIKKLFLAYCKLKKIDINKCNIKNIFLSPYEKINEDLDFQPIVTIIDDTNKIVKILKSIM